MEHSFTVTDSEFQDIINGSMRCYEAKEILDIDDRIRFKTPTDLEAIGKITYVVGNLFFFETHLVLL